MDIVQAENKNLTQEEKYEIIALGSTPRVILKSSTLEEAKILKMFLEDKMPLEEFFIKESK